MLGQKAAAEEGAIPQSRAAEIAGLRNGYIEAIDDERVMQTACGNDLLLELHKRLGNFFVIGQGWFRLAERAC